MSITKISPSVVDFDAGITITTDDNSNNLTLTSTDADANSGPNLDLYRNSSSPATSDVLGTIFFHGEDGAGNKEEYVRVQSVVDAKGSGSEVGVFQIFTNNAGTLTNNRFEIDGTEVTINESGGNFDFRVESDGNANAIFVNAGDDRVTFFNGTTVNAASGTDDGVSHYSDGRTDISRASAQPLNIRRRTDDGVAINFYKEASGTVTNVGAIGVQSSDLVIHSNTASHVGLQFGNTRLHPTDNSGSTTDGVADLGFSTTRWKDLYLSGGVVFDAVAGDATSNTLDDYEEGSFTIGVENTTATLGNTTAYYTKIGRLVYFFWYSGNSTFASSSSTATLNGLPFHQDGLSANYGLFQYVHGNAVDGDSTGGYINNNGTKAFFVDNNSFAGATFIDGSTKYIMIQGIYQTDA